MWWGSATVGQSSNLSGWEGEIGFGSFDASVYCLWPSVICLVCGRFIPCLWYVPAAEGMVGVAAIVTVRHGDGGWALERTTSTICRPIMYLADFSNWSPWECWNNIISAMWKMSKDCGHISDYCIWDHAKVFRRKMTIIS